MVEEIIELLNNGVDPEEIAQIMGISLDKVCEIIETNF